jgi:hypothetical protein
MGVAVTGCGVVAGCGDGAGATAQASDVQRTRDRIGGMVDDGDARIPKSP